MGKCWRQQPCVGAEKKQGFPERMSGLGLTTGVGGSLSMCYFHWLNKETALAF